MSAEEHRDKYDAERRDADARYNDALTTFDRAVADCRGRPLAREDFDRLSHALIMVLQQITAFVETKDRAIAADIDARLAEIDRLRASVEELITRVGLLQRQTRSIQPGPPRVAAPAIEPPAANLQSPHDVVYVGFEDAFRGSDASVSAKLRTYVPIFAGAVDVVDLGCGRGEFLAALKEAGIRARGVDVNAEMAAVARERGLDVEQGDALGFVTALADESIGGAIATQVVEHLEPSYLTRLLDALARKLRPGAPIVLETINPACWLAFFSSYIRDLTHVRPIHPDTLQYLLRASGFERVEIRYSAPVPDQMKMRTIEIPADVLARSDASAVALARVAHTINANATILNSLMFTHLDYAAVGYRA
jgi:SAM-dependent methyltransferase